MMPNKRMHTRLLNCAVTGPSGLRDKNELC